MFKRAILIALITLISIEFIGAQPANAECTTKTCISVYIEDGKIVIDAKRNGATNTPKPRIAPTKAPVVRKPVIPRPTYKPSYKPSYKTTYRPRVSKPAARRSSPSLADKILQSLPTLQVAYQPEGTVLPKVPVIFFTDLPKDFQKNFKILGESVKINVKPRSLWNFGDGFVLVTSKPGAPYPSRDITHSYSVPGTYLVTVSTLWSGTFTVAGVTTEIPGRIEQNSYVEVKVVGASTKFVGK